MVCVVRAAKLSNSVSENRQTGVIRMNHVVGQGLPRECAHYCSRTILSCLSENRNNMKSGECLQQKYLSIIRKYLNLPMLKLDVQTADKSDHGPGGLDLLVPTFCSLFYTYVCLV